MGGGGSILPPPPPLVEGVGTKYLRAERVKRFYMTFDMTGRKQKKDDLLLLFFFGGGVKESTMSFF